MIGEGKICLRRTEHVLMFTILKRMQENTKDERKFSGKRRDR
jgi:hypothetical protein